MKTSFFFTSEHYSFCYVHNIGVRKHPSIFNKHLQLFLLQLYSKSSYFCGSPAIDKWYTGPNIFEAL